MIKAVLFDLDGTLLNTLKDLNEASNHTLRYFNLPLVTINQTKQFIGNGVKMLLKRSAFNADIDYELAYEVFKKYYRNHIKDYTSVYDGIIDVLKYLKSKNIKIAVTSNKYQEGVEILVNDLLNPYIDIALGSSETVKVKPHPDMVNIVLDKLNVSSDQCLFIGDSDVDIVTGKTNNIKTIGVTWGYKDKKVLENEKPDYLIDNQLELIKIIKEINNYE